MNHVFQINVCPYDLRNPRIIAFKHKSCIKYSIYTTNFKSPQICQNIPLEIRNSESCSLFKPSIGEYGAFLVTAKLAIHS